jgi:hypothetical protein
MIEGGFDEDAFANSDEISLADIICDLGLEVIIIVFS